MTTFKKKTAPFWDARYANDAYAYGTEPNAYLVEQRHRLQPGMKALVPADGEGRNGVWLAEQGLDVTSVDISEAGVQKMQRFADARGVTLHTVHADLTEWDWPTDHFDVIVSVYFHVGEAMRVQLHHAMLAALRPGGIIILEAFCPAQLAYRDVHGSGGPPNLAMLYSAATLRNDFARAEVLELAEVETELHEGPFHNGLASVVRGVFRRRET